MTMRRPEAMVLVGSEGQRPTRAARAARLLGAARLPGGRVLAELLLAEPLEPAEPVLAEPPAVGRVTQAQEVRAAQVPWHHSPSSTRTT